MTQEATRRLSDATYAELREIAARYPQAALRACCRCSTSCSRPRAGSRPRASRPAPTSSASRAAEVSGVATFYTMYKRRPVGDYHVGVCTNTLCAVMGGDAIFERLKEHLDVGNDETTDDGKITLEHVECNAACDYAPVMMVNWEFMDNMTPQSATELVDDLREGTEVHSTRGPRIVTWREAERVLAGFPDDLVDEGPAAGPASLVGLGSPASTAGPPRRRQRARQHGDTKTEAVEQADTGRARPRRSRRRPVMADTLTPVLTDNWDDERPGRSRRTSAAAATAPCRRRWRWRPTTSSPRSRTPGCAAAAAPASRPA